MVPGTGIEPVRRFQREILSLLCLPISPSGRGQGLYLPLKVKKGKRICTFPFLFGAGEESRTLDLYLGKVSLYQLSYSRVKLWRREPESNRPTRICNPVHNRFAIAPRLPHDRYCIYCLKKPQAP